MNHSGMKKGLLVFCFLKKYVNIYIPRIRQARSSSTKGIPFVSNMFALVRLGLESLNCPASSPVVINTRGTMLLLGTSLLLLLLVPRWVSD